MANNLRYLLEHFCLDGQKIDISSQLDEENANNIEKINTQTVPSINAKIDDIKNTDIPNINRRVDSIKNTDIPSINQKINTINNTTIPNVQENVNAVNEKADRINESVAKNTRDIGTLSDNVTMQGNTINSIETEKIPSVENKVNGLTTIVSTNTDSINELNTKVNTNTDSINTINNTSIPHLQSEIDSLSGGGSGSIGELRTQVEKNTSDISALSGKVETNTTAINTINNTSIPNLQSEIDNIKGSGTGSLGELRTKVEKNTGDIAELSGKVETNTTAINTINNTSIPNLQSEIDNIKGSGTGSLGELRTKVEKNTGDIAELSGKVETNTTAINTINNTSIPNLQSEIDNIKGSGTGSLGELRTKVEKNTGDIAELTGKVNANTSDISDIKNHMWKKIIDQRSHGIHVEIFQPSNLPLIELHATLTFPQTTPVGLPIEIRIPNGKEYAPQHLMLAPVHIPDHFGVTGYLYAAYRGNDLIVGFNMNEYEIDDIGESTLLYRY